MRKGVDRLGKSRSLERHWPHARLFVSRRALIPAYNQYIALYHFLSSSTRIFFYFVVRRKNKFLHQNIFSTIISLRIKRTMADNYSKLKNAELESLLKERGLPHTGKKADMVARLQDDDKTKSSTTGATPVTNTTATADDVIDWDDDKDAAAPPTKTTTTDAAPASTEPAAAAIAAGGITRVDNPVDVPNQVPAIDPSQTSDLTTAANPSTTNDSTSASEPIAEQNPAQSFAANLASTDFEAELTKRKARAAKFGIVESDDDARKAIERAAKFGTGAGNESAVLGKLDQALPEKRERGVKRAAEGVAGAKPANGQNGGEKRRKGGENGEKVAKNGEKAAKQAPATKSETNAAKPAQSQQKKANGGTSWMSEADKIAAEKRKARFGAPTGATSTASPDPAIKPATTS